MTKKVGITGMAGFVGSHLRDRLACDEGVEVQAWKVYEEAVAQARRAYEEAVASPKLGDAE